jgi:DNA replication protein DnaC
MSNRTLHWVTPARTELHRMIRDDFQAMHIPLLVKAGRRRRGPRAKSERLSHVAFLRVLVNKQADRCRERRIADRIREGGLAEERTLVDFDWQFDAAAIDRVQVEMLAGSEFIGRRQNLVRVRPRVGGKSHLTRAINQLAWAVGYWVQTKTGSTGLQDPTAATAN